MTQAAGRLATALADRYRIERELGQGGMATVFLAQDLKHDRKVALKVLRPELAAVIGAERFLNEIKVTANLQHPHILPLHDSGEADSFLFYVMPYVEGESLRDRLEREKQLGVEEAVEIGRNVAAALDYAHRHNVIHRDVKPENILLHDGQPMVADFGIALALSHAGGTRLTETGLSIGTPQYMSPEQAMGDRELDARSDQYSLAAVLYEMLTGEPPYTGATAQAIVARVITEDPRPLALQRRTVPAHVAASVHKALSKLPADRFHTAAAFAEALRTPGAVSTATGTPATALARPAVSAPARVVMGLGGLAVGLAALATWGWLRPTPPQPVSRFIVTFEEGALTYAYDPPAITPDGGHIAYSNLEGALLIRSRDRLEGTPVPGAENGWSPFFSPDGATLGFMTGFPGSLSVVPVSGGAPTTLVPDSAYGNGASWSEDGWIYYTGTAGGVQALMRVPAGGGEPQLVAAPDPARDELFFFWPEALPGGRTVLVTLWRRRGTAEIAAIDVATGTRRVVTTGVRALYAPTGHLVVLRGDGSLHAAGFDPAAVTLRGTPVQLVDGIAVSFQGRTPVALSRSGTLLYQTYRPVTQVVRVSRDGAVSVVDATWTGAFGPLDVSPDGRQLAIAIADQGRLDLWVKALPAGPLTRVAFGGTTSYRPSWAPDGRSVLFISDQGGRSALYRVPADGSAPPEVVLEDPRAVDEGHLSRDGGWLVYRRGSGGGRDVLARRTDGDGTPVAVATTEFDEFSPAISPDARWIAYSSLQSGRPEVYVRPFPQAAAARIQVSREGGTEPRWAHSGRELFYRNAAGGLVAAAVATDPAFRVTQERVLFSATDYVSDNRHRNYAVAPDDRSFYFARELPGPRAKLVVVLNWFEELQARVR